mgnify:CR=1 FL=1
MDVPGITSPPEVEKTIEHAWLFDVDGVITNSEQKRVTEPRILDEIIKRLQAGEMVALITGRSLKWVEERVLNPLEEKIENKEILDNLFVSGEFGGPNLKYLRGEKVYSVDPNISVPQEIVDSARAISEEFSKTMMWDESKKTMVSIEMKDGIAISDFSGPQSDLVRRLDELLGEKGLKEKYWIHRDLIGTNIMERTANKSLATKQVLTWLRENGIKPENFVAFGDNKSDLEIGNEISLQGLPVQFVFVGGKELLENQKFDFPVIFTNGIYENGTLEYLTSNT